MGAGLRVCVKRGGRSSRRRVVRPTECRAPRCPPAARRSRPPIHAPRPTRRLVLSPTLATTHTYTLTTRAGTRGAAVRRSMARGRTGGCISLCTRCVSGCRDGDSGKRGACGSTHAQKGECVWEAFCFLFLHSLQHSRGRFVLSSHSSLSAPAPPFPYSDARARDSHSPPRRGASDDVGAGVVSSVCCCCVPVPQSTPRSRRTPAHALGRRLAPPLALTPRPHECRWIRVLCVCKESSPRSRV